MGISNLDPGAHERRPWNAGSLVGAKRPLKPRDVWAIRFFLDGPSALLGHRYTVSRSAAQSGKFQANRMADIRQQSWGVLTVGFCHPKWSKQTFKGASWHNRIATSCSHSVC